MGLQHFQAGPDWSPSKLHCTEGDIDSEVALKQWNQMQSHCALSPGVLYTTRLVLEQGNIDNIIALKLKLQHLLL